MKYKYGITESDYDRMMQEQEGRCAICNTTQTKDKNMNRLVVDHCHTSGKVRGLLCSACNKALGILEDSVDVLKSAVEYLTKHKEQT